MKIDVDTAERSVSVSVPASFYSDDALRIAAQVFSKRADIYHEKSKTVHDLTLVAKRRDLDAGALEALGGDFLNELLNQEYRFIVARFNRRIADLISARALLSARGGENPPPAAHPAEQTPEFRAEAEALLKAAEEEVARTMPRKIAPQGALFPKEADAR